MINASLIVSFLIFLILFSLQTFQYSTYFSIEAKNTDQAISISSEIFITFSIVRFRLIDVF